jgi:hypothetical protein
MWDEPEPTEGDCYVPYFDRQGKQLKTIDEWTKLLGDPEYHRIALTRIGPVYVSTIWTGLDFGWCEDIQPTIFETMTFNRLAKHENKGWARNRMTVRYSTEEEARKGHERIVNQIRARGVRIIWCKELEKEFRRAWGLTR